MAEKLQDEESRLAQVERAVAAIERRLATLEASPPRRTEAPSAAAPNGPAGVAASARPAATDAGTLLPLLGRTSLVFAGAYLLRALVESGQLPMRAAVPLGVAYALVWLGAADRAAIRNRSSAVFHGVTSMIIAYPLLWEASTRFGFFGPSAGAALIAVVSGLALAVAWRRRLQSVAAAASLGSVAAALAVAFATGGVIPQALFLVLLGIGTLWLSYERNWYWIRWVPALAADGVVVALTARALQHPPLDQPEAVMAVQLFLLASYLSSFAARTVVRGRTVIFFEVLQTGGALVAGLGGALGVAQASGAGMTALGLAGATLGVGCYAVAFAFIRRGRGSGTNFHFYLTLALALVLIGGAVLLPGPALGLALAALAVAASWLGSRLGQVALTVQAAIYGLGAAIASGLASNAAMALLGTPGDPAVACGVVPLSVLAALLACLAIAAPAPPAAAAPAAGARLVVALLAVLGGTGVLIDIAAPALAGKPFDAGTLATVRSGALALAAVLLAAAARLQRARELAWLLYPVLALTGLKLLVEDLRVSRPATLFVALALYGLALVAAPRLAKKRRGPEPGEK